MVKRLGYFSYLLRLWQAEASPEALWRASLEAIPSGEYRAFAHLDALIAYLYGQMEASSSPEQGDVGEERRGDPG